MQCKIYECKINNWIKEKIGTSISILFYPLTLQPFYSPDTFALLIPLFSWFLYFPDSYLTLFSAWPFFSSIFTICFLKITYYLKSLLLKVDAHPKFRNCVRYTSGTKQQTHYQILAPNLTRHPLQILSLQSARFLTRNNPFTIPHFFSIAYLL